MVFPDCPMTVSPGNQDKSMLPFKIHPGEHQYIPLVLQNGRSFKRQNSLTQCPFCHLVALSFPSCDFPKVKVWDKLAQEGGVEGRAAPSGWGYPGAQTVAVFWHVAPHSHLPCSPKQRQTVLKPLWLLPPAVLETGAQGSCCLPAVFRLLLHPTLPSSQLSGYECSFLATDLSVYMQSFTCLCAFMKGNTETSTGTCSSCWLWRKVVCICLLVFFIMQPKLCWQG